MTKKIKKTILKNATKTELPKTTKDVVFVLFGDSLTINGKRTYISAKKLQMLYNLTLEQCRFVEIHELQKRNIIESVMSSKPKEYILLYPRSENNYSEFLNKLLEEKGVVNGQIIT